jgi:hypothetical protein
MFSNLGINEKKLLELMNNNAIDDTKCDQLFLNIDKYILSKYTTTQIKKIQIKLLEYGKLPTKMGKELTKPVEIDDMLPFIYSLIQQIYEDNQDIYNFDKIEKDKDVNNSSTGYNFDSFEGTLPLPIVIYRSLYVNESSWPYYAEIKYAFTDPEKEHIIEQKTHSKEQKTHSKEQKTHSKEQKKHSIEQKTHSIDQKYPLSIVKKLQDKKLQDKKLQDKKIQIENKYIPIGCKQDGTIAYAYVSLIKYINF